MPEWWQDFYQESVRHMYLTVSKALEEALRKLGIELKGNVLFAGIGEGLELMYMPIFRKAFLEGKINVYGIDNDSTADIRLESTLKKLLGINDFSAKVLNRPVEYGNRKIVVRYKRMDIRNLSKETFGIHFDFVTLNNVLVYCEGNGPGGRNYDAIEEIIRAVARVLKPGGILQVTTEYKGIDRCSGEITIGWDDNIKISLMDVTDPLRRKIIMKNLSTEEIKEMEITLYEYRENLFMDLKLLEEIFKKCGLEIILKRETVLIRRDKICTLGIPIGLCPGLRDNFNFNEESSNERRIEIMGSENLIMIYILRKVSDNF